MSPATFPLEVMKKTKKKAPRRAARAGYKAPALEKGIEIIELLAEEPGGLPISEIAKRLHRSMNEVFRIIVVMEGHGWLKKDFDTDRYSVTYHLLEMAMRATPARSLTTVAGPVMNSLSSLCNQSCHLVVRAGGRGLLIQREENASLQGGFALRPGANVDLARSCSGHVLLAFAPAYRYQSILRQLPRPLSWSAKKIEARIAQVRRRGYEMQQSARTTGVTDVGFPIFGSDGEVVAALTVPYLAVIDKTSPPTLNQTRELLRTAAREVSMGLGWSPNERTRHR
ncbi:MAG: IclR family transcriptional regulator [Pseudomonadota bacterium]